MSQTITQETSHVALPQAPETKFERERRAFYRLLPEVLATHRGQYVAIHHEEVVASGLVRIDVVFQALRLAQADIYVGVVGAEPPRVIRISGPRIVGSGPVVYLTP